MTKDEIIKLAREAGIDPTQDTLCRNGGWEEPMEAFARACYEAGRTAEREECAKMADAEARRKKEIGVQEQNTVAHLQAVALSKLSDAIRARGKP